MTIPHITDLSTAAPVTEDLTNSESLLVYNTNTTTGKGFYYWDSTQWVAVGGSAENIYTSDGSLPETRTVNLDENILRFDNGVGRYLNLQGASVSDNNDPFLFTTFNALRFDIDNAPVLSLDSDQNVGVGLSDANAKLHIFENTGTAASASTGTLVLEHGNEGGASSIVFKSRSNNNSDYGYLNFSDDVVFPHQFLEEIISNLYSNKRMITKKVYEGTIPDKFFNISVFLTDQIIRESDIKLPEKINNKFKKIRMSYYQDNQQTPVFEQTVNLNDQGIANFFRYDYADYSLILKLKKINLVNLNCD
mgnify:CR=1 FL=1